MQKYLEVLYLSRILILASFVILVHKIYMTNDVSDFTYIWIFLVLIAQFLLVFFGFANNEWGVVVPSVFVSAGVMYILITKLTQNKNEKVKEELEKKNII
jgi:hypothetical protein